MYVLSLTLDARAAVECGKGRAKRPPRVALQHCCRRNGQTVLRY